MTGVNKMDDTVIKEIRKSEEKAKNIIEDSKKKSGIVGINASEEARKKEITELESYNKEMEKKFQKESESIKKDGDEIISKGKANSIKITKRAESNSGEAISFLMKKFKETL